MENFGNTNLENTKNIERTHWNENSSLSLLNNIKNNNKQNNK